MAGWAEPLEKAKVPYKQDGLPRTLAIANRVLDELARLSINITEVWHSPHTVALQTAEAYKHAIEMRSAPQCSLRSRIELDPDSKQASPSWIVGEFAERLPRIADRSAIVIIGHQPMLTVIARKFARKFLRRLPADTLPLANSEAACMAFDEKGKAVLLWMLTEKSDDLLEDLKDKIKSKYDVAKFFLGAFVVNTGFLFSNTIWGAKAPTALWLIVFGFLLALIALALTAATLMSYDSLLMPAEFWSGSTPVEPRADGIQLPKRWSVHRPPSQAHVVLFYEMIHVWRFFFIPALWFALASIATFMVAMVVQRFKGLIGREAGAADLALMIGGAGLAAGLALVVPLVIYRRLYEPRLGFED
jgi:phosphohistidine phosphatase SixA